MWILDSKRIFTFWVGFTLFAVWAVYPAVMERLAGSKTGTALGYAQEEFFAKSGFLRLSLT